MNRFRKEEKRKLAEDVGELSEVSGEYVSNPCANPEFLRKVMILHLELFPEEYDFIQDSGADLKMRKQGASPMSQDYLNHVNFRRASLGVPKISGIKIGVADESWDFCMKKLLEERESWKNHCFSAACRVLS